MAFEQQSITFQTKKILGVGEFAVNSKLPLDLEKPLKKVISVNALAETSSCELIDTDFNILGKSQVNVIYLTENDTLESVTANVDWNYSLKVAGENPEAFVTVKEIVVEGTSMSEVALNILHNVEAEGVTKTEVTPLPEIADDYVTNLNNLELKKLASRASSKFTLAETLESASNAKSVLNTFASVKVKNVTAGIDQVTVEGEAIVKVLYLTEDGSNVLNKIIEFKQEVPAMGAMPSEEAEAKVYVTSASCALEIGEKCNFVLAINLGASVSSYKTENLSVVDDLFSVTNNIETTYDCVNYSEYGQMVFFADSVNLSVTTDNTVAQVIDTINPKVEISKQIIENNYLIAEGVVSACLIYKTEDGNVQSTNMVCPFISKTDATVAGSVYNIQANANVLSTKLRAQAEVETIIELDFVASVLKENYFEYVKAVNVVGERDQLSSAVTIYVTKEGERLFDVARALGITPETITNQNEIADGKFTNGQRVFVYNPLNAQF